LSPQSLRELWKDAAAAPGITQRELRRGVKAGGNDVRDAVRSGAAEFSRDIPAKVKTRVSFARNASVTIIVDDPSGEAGALNNRDRSGTFRHPSNLVPNVWVTQTAHPFFLRKARPAAEGAVTKILAAMNAIATQLGFH
jgi:hypothetical protein